MIYLPCVVQYNHMDPVEEIKSKLDVVQFITPYVGLKQAGRNFKGLCPFHGEKTPSFMVSQERQTWHCFGCNSGGDVISFYQKIEHLEFYEALQALAERTGVQLTHREPEELKKKHDLYSINELAAKFYHHLLTKHPIGKQALDYLVTDRKMLPTTIDAFQLGFAPEGWSHLGKFLRKHKIDEKLAIQIGLIGRNSRGTYDYFRSRIMFPLHDHRGNVVGFAGRVFGGADEKTAKYINTPETPIYNKGSMLYGLYQNADAVREAKSLLLVEGEFDVLSAVQVGVKNVAAIKGTALTQPQISLIKRYAQTLLLALDQDNAGQAATRRSIELAQESGLTVRIVTQTTGKDIDDLAKTSPKTFKQAVSEARPYYDWLLHNILSKHDLNDPFAKQKAAEEALPFLWMIDNEIVREHYLKILAKELDSSYFSLIKTGQKMKTKKTYRSPAPTPVEPTTPHDVALAQYLLALILHTKKSSKVIGDIADIVSDIHLTQSGEKILFEKLLAAYEKAPETFQLQPFLSSLGSHFDQLLDLISIAEVPESIIKDEQKLDHEIIKTAQDLKRIGVRQRLASLKDKLAEHTNPSDPIFRELNDEFKLLKQELKALS